MFYTLVHFFFLLFKMVFLNKKRNQKSKRLYCIQAFFYLLLFTEKIWQYVIICSSISEKKVLILALLQETKLFLK